MLDQLEPLNLDRRRFTALGLGLCAALGGAASAQGAPALSAGPYLTALRDRPVSITILLFEGMDQIDLTGPYAVLARLPDAALQIAGPSRAPVRDHKGLSLTPDVALSEAGRADVLVVPGGPGQERQMQNAELLSVIAKQVEDGRAVFSVCTGALLCGAAGVLRGRRATTHWSAVSLLPYFGAEIGDGRVVVDGDFISAAGLTAGIDGALVLAALLRGPEVAQQIQLDLQYAPEPSFSSGTPEAAPADVLAAVKRRYAPLTEARLATARDYANAR